MANNQFPEDSENSFILRNLGMEEAEDSEVSESFETSRVNPYVGAQPITKKSFEEEGASESRKSKSPSSQNSNHLGEFEEDLDDDLDDDLDEVLDDFDDFDDEEDSDDENAFDDEKASDDIEEFTMEENEADSEKGSVKKRALTIGIIILSVLIVGVILAIVLVYLQQASINTEHESLNTYFGIEEGQIGIYVDGTRFTEESLGEGAAAAAIIVDNHYYLSNAFVASTITDKFYEDSEGGELLYTTASEIWHIPYDSVTYTVGENSAEYAIPIALRREDQVYLSLDYVMEIDGYGMCYYVDYAPERIFICSNNIEEKSIAWKQGTVTIRMSDSLGAKILTDFVLDDTETMPETAMEWYVAAESEKDGKWTKVSNIDGRTGYVLSEEIASTDAGTISYTIKEKVAYPTTKVEGDIVLAWQGIYGTSDNDKIQELTQNTTGLNTISPTWYKVVDAEGTISTSPEDENSDQTPLVDEAYIEYVHSLGMKLWPLVSDFTSSAYGWDEKTLFASASARNRMIQFLIEEAEKYGYDGWNLDFEKVPSEAGLDYIQFLREFSIECRKEGLVLSVDNYVPRAHSAYYRRADQGECVDYVIVMGYDEHWDGDSEAGSTASLPFVKEGLDATLLEVPAEKVIMGVPFYCRLWVQSVDEAGNTVLDSVTRGMKSYDGVPSAMEAVEAHQMTVTWDETLGQNVATGTDEDGKFYSIWIEDDESMRVRMKAIRERKVAGVAAWSLGFESEDVWEIICNTTD